MDVQLLDDEGVVRPLNWRRWDVILKRSIGNLYPEHFAGVISPIKTEVIMDPPRFNGDRMLAHDTYESMMELAFSEVSRVLKPGGTMVCVYAHKTTAGWATLVDALRRKGFVVTEAWPLDTENPVRQRAQGSAALASSIFLVARKREGREIGQYNDVKAELDTLVRDRVRYLWDQGISGADLVISAVGAGLKAFTKYGRVEYENGEEVPAEHFLADVEGVVLDTILARLSKVSQADGSEHSLSGVDSATRFYILWRFTYRSAEVEPGEAIVFANGTNVEIDGPEGMSTGTHALVEKKKGKYRLLDFTDRGAADVLGHPGKKGDAGHIIDALHRTLWLLENDPSSLGEFLRDARPNREQMRLVAQVLAGPALSGGEVSDVSPSMELASLRKLTSNWKIVVDSAFVETGEQEQKRLDTWEVS